MCLAQLLIVAVFMLASRDCLASAFALREQSGTALGNAFAGATATAEDASYMFFNPAALARQRGSQVVSVASYIRPIFSFNAKRADTAAGVPIGGGDGGSDAADDALLPALYAVWDISDRVKFIDNLKLGLGITSPFGLETDYNDGWIGRYHALQSKLRTVNFTPTIAFDVAGGLSVGIGMQAQHAEAELSNAIDFGSLAAGIPALAPVARPTRQDGKARVEGDDWAFGFVLGALYQPWEGTRLGVGYRSQMNHRLAGDARFRLGHSGVGAAIAGATGAFKKTGAEATLKMPANVSFGGYQEIGDQWAVMGEAQWTGWHCVDELRVRFDNPTQPDNVTATDWNDTWFFALGATYRPSTPWAIRFGAAFDQTPVPNSKRTPRVPDNDRYWLSVGTSYQALDRLRVSLSYAHIFANAASIRLSASDEGSRARGSLSGNVDASVDIVGFQAQWAF